MTSEFYRKVLQWRCMCDEVVPTAFIIDYWFGTKDYALEEWTYPFMMADYTPAQIRLYLNELQVEKKLSLDTIEGKYAEGLYLKFNDEEEQHE